MPWEAKGVNQMREEFVRRVQSGEKTKSALCREYGIVPVDVRFVSSYALLATRIGRGEGFSIDSKMFDTPASPMKLTYLPVKWALSGTVVMAWRRHHVPEHVTRFVEFLRPGTTENEEWTV